MKTIILFSLGIMVTTPSVHAQHSLKFDLQLEKSTYLVGEPVQVGISYVNVISGVIRGLNSSQTGLRVLDEKGREVNRAGVSGNHWSPSKNELKSGEEDYRVIELNQYFGKSYGGLLMGGVQYFDDGLYVVKAIFHPPGMSPETTEVSFKVVQPEGDEAIAYNSFLEILKRDREHGYTGIQLAEAIGSLHKAHPNSVYTPYFLAILDAVYDIRAGDHAKSLLARKELVEKYPWSVQGQGMLEGILKRMQSDGERIEYLKKLHTASKGTLMEKVFQKKLQKELTKEDR